MSDIRVEIKASHDWDLDEYQEMFEQRKRTFVDELGWDLPDYAGGDFEIDLYDDLKVRYVGVYVDDVLTYTARLLLRDSSMMKDLWPKAFSNLWVRETSMEVSRFVRHQSVPKEIARMCIIQFREALLGLGSKDFFAVADKAVMLFYKRVLDYPPSRVETYSEYPGLFFPEWFGAAEKGDMPDG